MGNTCKPMAVSFQCMTKFTTNKILKKEAIVHLRFNKIILKVKKKKKGKTWTGHRFKLRGRTTVQCLRLSSQSRGPGFDP